MLKRAEEALRGGRELAFLELLDMFPALLLHPQRFPWVAQHLFRQFRDHAYQGFVELKQRYRKVGSDDDLVRAAMVQNARLQLVDLPEAKQPGARLRFGEFERGLTEEKAIEEVAKTLSVSAEAVKQSVKRTRRRFRGRP